MRRGDPPAAQPLPRPRRGGAGGRGPRPADPRGARRGGRGPAARLRRALGARGGPRPAHRRARRRRGGRRRASAPARASCTPTTSSPALGWRALAAARTAGARVVLHLHNYRLVCAVGTCFTRGADCTRCHGRNTLPGVRLNCRGGSRAESAAYAAGLALWQERIAAAADAFVVPSAFALGAAAHARRAARRPRPRDPERPAHVRGALRRRRRRLRALRGPAHAGEGRRGRDRGLPRRGRAARRRRRRARARTRCAPPPGPDVRFMGRVGAGELAALRAGAAVALVPSRYEEILPLAALEAMAAGLPSSPRARAGSPRSCPRPACTRRATSPRWPRASARCGATRTRGTPRSRSRASARRRRWSRRRCARSTAE